VDERRVTDAQRVKGLILVVIDQCEVSDFESDGERECVISSGHDLVCEEAVVEGTEVFRLDVRRKMNGDPPLN